MAAVQSPQVPTWLAELRLAYESGAHGQFVLYGNVADRFPLEGQLVSLTRYLDAQLLAGFDVVFLYDPGNGLSLLRGGERLAEWPAGRRRHSTEWCGSRRLRMSCGRESGAITGCFSGCCRTGSRWSI